MGALKKLTWLFFGLCLWLGQPLLAQAPQEKLHVLVVTGGHDFDRDAFFAMFRSFRNVSFQELKHPVAFDYLTTQNAAPFQVIVFYDMHHKIAEEERKNLLGLLKQGKGMVFLHHALVSYEEWPEHANIVGGHYYQKPHVKEGRELPASSYSHDEPIEVRVEDKNHPVTKNVGNFSIFDETYGDFWVSDKVHPLLSTDHPKSTKIIGWANRYLNSRIVYLQPGHGPQIFGEEPYRKLVLQAMQWVSEKP
ncbi:hypothetical protein BH24BAC1_BH24BAC1_21890 [soil metagenome]